MIMRRFRNQKGQAAAVLLLLSATFLVTAFFAVDAGNYYLAVQRLKRACDSAALKSWIMLNSGGGVTESDVEAKAEEILSFNFQGTSFWPDLQKSATASTASMTVSVSGSVNVRTIFLRLIPGNEQLGVSFTSTARASATPNIPKLDS